MSAPGETHEDRRKNWIIDKLAAGKSTPDIASPDAARSDKRPTAEREQHSGRRDEVARASREEEERIVGTNIHVSNMAIETTEEELTAAIARTAPVKKVMVVKDADTGVSRGYGFYIMENESDVEASIRDLNGYMLGDRALRVSVARKQYNGMAAKYSDRRDAPNRGDSRRDYGGAPERRPDRRRDDVDRHRDYAGYGERPHPAQVPYRGGEPVRAADVRDMRAYDYAPAYGVDRGMRVPISYPSDGYGAYDRGPVDRYAPVAGGDRYRSPVEGYGMGGAGLSPALSRYDNRYDIVHREDPRLGAEPYPPRGVDRYPVDLPYSAEPRRGYGEPGPAAGYGGYGAREAPRRSRSRSREKYPVVYDRALPTAGYSGDGYRPRDGGYGSLSAPATGYPSGGYGSGRLAAADDAYSASSPYGTGERLDYPRRGEAVPAYRGRPSSAGPGAPPYDEYSRRR